MTWDIICSVLGPFGIGLTRRGSFTRGTELLLLEDDSADLPGAVYVAAGGEGPSFRQALVISVGPWEAAADNFIQVRQGTLPQVFNALGHARGWLERLDSTLALCDDDQEIVDRASEHMGLPMFYLDGSYRILAMTRDVAFEDDPEWEHMASNGYLSPGSARQMKELGELDMLAEAREPVIYKSGLYPFTSVVCNVWQDGAFVSRLNVLFVSGKPTALMIRACEIAVRHLGRVAAKRGNHAVGGPIQTILTDLLRGIRLPEELILDRLQTAPYLADNLLQLFYVDVKAKQDRQIASYYAAALRRLHPEDPFLPLVFEEQLILLAYAPNEGGFDSLTVKLAHFFAAHGLRCGVSDPFRRLSDLRGFCGQAEAALVLESGEGLHFYRSVMLEHLLSHIPTERIPFLTSPDIARLEAAEKQFSFSLTNTLQAYLECNCNLIRTAERLFLHKNTLLYRLNHIKSIIRCDLNDADQRLLLLLSFKLMNRN